ncbi:MAG: hypothetical protein WA949_07750 [Phormidesmis sp.]
MLSRELAQRLDVWMAEVDAFCAAAHERLDELEAGGKEPMLDDESLDELVSSELPFYFSTDSLESELEANEPQERHRQLRLSLQVEPMAETATSVNAITDVLDLAHAEDVDLWQRAISAAIPKTVPIGFTELLAVSKIEPVELLIGLLLGPWRLDQEEFYGEIKVWPDN